MMIIIQKISARLLNISLFVVALNACAPEKAELDVTSILHDIDIVGIDLTIIEPVYNKECNNRRDERRAVIEGNLTLTNNAEVEKFRCIKRVKGDLIIDAESLVPGQSSSVPYPGVDNSIMTLFTLPWLQRVDGELKLISSAFLTKGQFPRLHTVGGRILINNRGGQALWVLPALQSHDSTLEIIAGVANNLQGFTRLKTLNRLELRTHPNDRFGPFNFSGLEALETVSRLEINMRSINVPNSFLSNLKSVTSNVDILVKDSGLNNYPSLATISGRLTIENSPFIFNLNSFAQLNNLDSLALNDNAGLNNVTALNTVTLNSGGFIQIKNNPALGDCNARQLVRELRNDPGWNSFNGSNTFVSGNGSPDC